MAGQGLQSAIGGNQEERDAGRAPPSETAPARERALFVRGRRAPALLRALRRRLEGGEHNVAALGAREVPVQKPAIPEPEERKY